MGALTPTYGLRGGCSTTFTIGAGAFASADTVTNASLIAGLPAGPLLTFLSTAHANALAADVAFRALGGQFDVRQTAGTAGTSTPVIIFVAAGVVPAIQVTWTGIANATLEITISVRHSIVQ